MYCVGAFHTYQEYKFFGREDSPRHRESVVLDLFEGHPIRVAGVELNTRCCYQQHILVLEYPVKPNDVCIPRFEGKRSLNAVIGKDIDKLDTDFSALDRQDPWCAPGEFDSGYRTASRNGNLKIVFVRKTFDLDICVAMLYTEHLEVALVKEGTLDLVNGIEGDRYLIVFKHTKYKA